MDGLPTTDMDLVGDGRRWSQEAVVGEPVTWSQELLVAVDESRPQQHQDNYNGDLYTPPSTDLQFQVNFFFVSKMKTKCSNEL